jgi:hypothetical protein
MGAVVLLPLISGCGNQTTVSPFPVELTDQELINDAETVAANLRAGEFDKIVARFDATMQQALPEEKLKSTWESVVTQIGPVKELGKPTQVTILGTMAVERRVTFERGELLLRIAYDGSKNISGLWILAVP